MKSKSEKKRHVVEFTHPGAEYLPLKRKADPNVIWDSSDRRSGTRKWNELNSHKRKFLSVSGQSTDGLARRPTETELTIWGEWEAQSTFSSTGLPKGEGPQFIHKPFLNECYDGSRRHNTDPYVYGDSFWYTNCKQQPNNFLTRLDLGSVIIFGTEKKEGFFLDTVFVVGEVFSNPLNKTLLMNASNQLKSTNFLHNNIARDDAKSHLKFYRGLMYTESPKFFSFVPSKPFSAGSPQFHERPLLSPSDEFELQKPGARTVCTRLMKDRRVNGSIPIEVARNYWMKLAHFCLKNGFSLATKIEEPPLRSC